MQKFICSMCLIFVFHSLIIGTGKTEITETQYEKTFHQLLSLQVNQLKIAKVNGLEIVREEGKFTLNSGHILFCQPINNRTIAAIFIGEGKFNFTPPDKIEQEHLYRFFESRSIDDRFDQQFLFFTDNTLELIDKKVEWQLNVSPELIFDANKRIEDCLEFLSDEEEMYFNSDFMKVLLDDGESDLFYTHIQTENNGDLFFQINPMKSEDVTFMREIDSRFVSRYEIINSYSGSNQNRKRTLYNYQQPSINVKTYKIDINIGSYLEFSSTAEIEFTPTTANQRWIKFRIYNELEIDSVNWSSGKKVEYFKGEENPYLWINIGDNNSVENYHKLSIHYHGELLWKNDFGWIQLKSSNYWFPKFVHQSLPKSIFDLNYRYLEDYTLLSVGNKLETDNDGDFQLERWKTKYPIRNASFNIGYFEEYNVQEVNAPPVSVYMSEGGHSMIAHAVAKYGLLSDIDLESVGIDIANSLRFFTHLFGGIPVDKVYATEIPYSHGEAFPGLLHLSWETFQNFNFEGGEQQFRAHEVAHQWWGIQVQYKSYHDKWLSEGLAEYSGLWYMQAALKNNDLFFDMLESWKNRILSNRVYLFGKGQEAGPISMGYRTSSTETRGDYGLIIYKKGAWVFHMLRQMLINLQTMNEDKFQNLLTEYFQTYSGRSASTKDFIRIVNKYFNEDMQWFFDQWIYDTKIPSYTFSYKTSSTADGKVKVTCRVNQENVPDNFRMYIPLKIEFENDRFARLRVLVTGKECTFDLPLLPAEPEDIIFNDLHSVLCEVDYESWD